MAAKLLVIANFLLVLATGALVYATVSYAKAARQMSRIAKLQAYINAQYTMNVSPSTFKGAIEKAAKPFIDRYEKNYEQELKAIFRFDGDA